MNEKPYKTGAATARADGPGLPFWLAFVFLVITALSWAGSSVAGRAASGSVPPFTLSFIRWLLVVLMFVCIGGGAAWRQRAVIFRHWGLMSAFGFFGVVGFTVPYYVGLQYTVAINASLMNASGTVWIVLTTFLMTGETVTRRQALGIALGFAGMVTIVLRGDIAALADFSLNVGDFLVLSAFFSWAVYTVLLRWKPREIGEIPFLIALTGFGTAMMLPLYLVDLANGATFALSAPNLTIIGYAAVFPSFLAYILWNRAVPVVGTGIAGMTQYMIPIFGTTLSVLVLGEAFRSYHAVGIAIIFAGVWLVTSGRRR